MIASQVCMLQLNYQYLELSTLIQYWVIKSVLFILFIVHWHYFFSYCKVVCRWMNVSSTVIYLNCGQPFLNLSLQEVQMKTSNFEKRYWNFLLEMIFIVLHLTWYCKCWCQQLAGSQCTKSQVSSDKSWAQSPLGYQSPAVRFFQGRYDSPNLL